jgi:tRNA pseudouridine65 synthase
MALAALKQKLKSIKWAPGVKLLNFDINGLISVEKPAGMLAHPNGLKDIGRAMIRSPYCHEREMFTTAGPETDSVQNVWLLNRLDSATSGVILLTVCPEVAESVRQSFFQHKVTKQYRAVVFGKYSPRAGEGAANRGSYTAWKDRIATTHNASGHLRSAVDETHGQACESRVELVRHLPGHGTPLSLLELTPVTGRTHQLRVHCARHSLPIVGDTTYGNFSLNQMTKWFPNFEDRLYLHAHRINLVYALDGKPHKFSSESKMSKLFL